MSVILMSLLLLLLIFVDNLNCYHVNHNNRVIDLSTRLYYHKKKVSKDFYKNKNDYNNDNINSNNDDIDIDSDIIDKNLLKGLIIERLGSRILVEIVNSTTNSYNSDDSNNGDNNSRVLCYQKSKLYEEMLVVGDKVLFKLDDNCNNNEDENDNKITKNKGIVISKFKRNNLLARPSPVGGKGIQMKIIAANIDQIVIVVSPMPIVPPLSTDRYLIAAKEFDMDAIILLNKCDLEGSQQFIQEHEHYKNLGYKILTLSTKQDIYSSDLDTLKNELANKTSIFVGQSGVGKSSLLNSLLPDANIKIGDLMNTSASNQLGSHTTSSSRLYHLSSGGHVIDSPGIREFGLWNLPKSSGMINFIYV